MIRVIFLLVFCISIYGITISYQNLFFDIAKYKEVNSKIRISQDKQTKLDIHTTWFIWYEHYSWDILISIPLFWDIFTEINLWEKQKFIITDFISYAKKPNQIQKTILSAINKEYVMSQENITQIIKKDGTKSFKYFWEKTFYWWYQIFSGSLLTKDQESIWINQRKIPYQGIVYHYCVVPEIYWKKNKKCGIIGKVEISLQNNNPIQYKINWTTKRVKK